MPDRAAVPSQARDPLTGKPHVVAKRAPMIHLYPTEHREAAFADFDRTK
jgi:hypothetical protein